MSQKSIILYSSGSPIIVDFEELCLKNKIEISAIVRNQKEIPCHATMQHKVIDPTQLNGYAGGFLIPLFSTHNRFQAVQEALSLGLNPFTLLSDKNNDLPTNFTNGVGCFINKRVVIGALSKIGDYVLINRGATLGHHLVLEDYVSIGPGVVTGGNVTLKKGAAIGTGAVLLPEITIGEHAIVGAGAVVAKDVEDYAIVVGNPAKVIKQNKNTF